MSIFNKFNEVKDIAADEDKLGGGFAPWESGAYPAVIELAYVDESKGGAMNINFVFKTSAGKELKQTVYVTSGRDKGATNYYTDKEGNKRFLPGYSLVNDICVLTLGNSLADVETETKTLMIRDFDLKKDVPTKKQVLTDLLGKEIILGVQKVIEDKYNKPGETRTINDISKVFRVDDFMTANEVVAEAEKAEFYTAWVEKNQGKTINKAGKSSGSKATPTTEDKPKKSLFAS